jgi:hypothetical protein
MFCERKFFTVIVFLLSFCIVGLYTGCASDDEGGGGDGDDCPEETTEVLGISPPAQICSPGTASGSMPSGGVKIFTAGNDFILDKPIIRGGESLWGNLVADAYQRFLVDDGQTPDFSLCGSGGLRIPEAWDAEGDIATISSGDDVNADVFVKVVGQDPDTGEDELDGLFPFENAMVTMTGVTYKEIKDALEQSVSLLPNVTCGASGNGRFLIPSAELEYGVNLAQPAIQIDENNEVTCPGYRIREIKIDGVAIFSAGEWVADENTTATIGMGDYFACVGRDDASGCTEGLGMFYGKAGAYESSDTRAAAMQSAMTSIGEDTGGTITRTIESRLYSAE